MLEMLYTKMREPAFIINNAYIIGLVQKSHYSLELGQLLANHCDLTCLSRNRSLVLESRPGPRW
jgi:hypothetical protein